MTLIAGFLTAIISFLGAFFYWVVMPILVYILLRIFILILKISDARDEKNFCRHAGYKGRRRWWD